MLNFSRPLHIYTARRIGEEQTCDMEWNCLCSRTRARPAREKHDRKARTRSARPCILRFEHVVIRSWILVRYERHGILCLRAFIILRFGSMESEKIQSIIVLPDGRWVNLEGACLSALDTRARLGLQVYDRSASTTLTV